MLLHVTTEAGWSEAVAAGGVSGVPFLHLCTRDQLAFVLERHFAGRTGLWVVELDPSGLDVRWEQSELGMAAFPHLYGVAPLSAVVSRRVLPG